jgi:tetratricopeptide (TPR) repeat protein
LRIASHSATPGPDPADAIAVLEGRIELYPAARYPVQRATALFHLGLALTGADRPAEAAVALREACELFDPERLPVEHAKAQNALGAALRARGAPAAAAAAFDDAAARFAAAGLGAEEGAARFNLGLVLRATGRADEAREALAAARALLPAESSPEHSAAAARELGAALLEAGEIERAVELLSEAAELAERAGDRAGAGAARNARGLAELARGRAQAAVDDFRAAAHAHPRGVRPADHAMAKANLALAYERCGQAAHARLAARQALTAGEVPEPVRAQADATIARLGARPGDVLDVLAAAPAGERTGIVRDEAVRWAVEPADIRRAEALAWTRSQTARPEGEAVDLAELLLGVMLELPPERMETLIAALLESLAGLPPAARESFRSTTSQAMARFHVPQLMRLRDTFERIAGDTGAEAWS